MTLRRGGLISCPCESKETRLVGLKGGSIIGVEVSLTCVSFIRCFFGSIAFILKTRCALLPDEPGESVSGACSIISTKRQSHKEKEASIVSKRDEEPVIGEETGSGE